ncbi:MAG: hypothetical protein RR894_18280 [Terrisporobacter sp.]
MNRTSADSCIFKDASGKVLYKITLTSVIYDSGTGKQTWKYYVEEFGGKNISNWALQLCKDANVSDTRPHTTEIDNPNEGHGKGNCLNIYDHIGCFYGSTSPVVDNQIKWNTDEEFTNGYFEFTLDKCYKSGDVHVSIKAGEECFCCMIQGPSCDPCPPEPGRGILFI